MRKFTQILLLALFSLVFSYSGKAQKKITSEASSPSLQKIDPKLQSSLQQNRQANTDMGQPNTTATMVSVEIKGIVTEALLKAIQTNGGKVFSSDAANNSIFARVPLPALETIALSNDVKYIQQSDLLIGNTKSSTGANKKEMLKAKAGKSSATAQQ